MGARREEQQPGRHEESQDASLEDEYREISERLAMLGRQLHDLHVRLQAVATKSDPNLGPLSPLDGEVVQQGPACSPEDRRAVA